MRVCTHVCMHRCLCLPASGLGVDEDSDLTVGKPDNTERKDKGRFSFEMSPGLEAAKALLFLVSK